MRSLYGLALQVSLQDRKSNDGRHHRKGEYGVAAAGGEARVP